MEHITKNAAISLATLTAGAHPGVSDTIASATETVINLPPANTPKEVIAQIVMAGAIFLFGEIRDYIKRRRTRRQLRREAENGSK